MQFPSGIALVRIGLRRCVTCVFELHAKFIWTRPCRRPPHRWGLVCCCVGEPRLCLAFGTKFSLLGFLVVRTVQNSPCMSKKRQIEPFRASRESFVPHMRWEGVCGESFVPHTRCEGCAGRVLSRTCGARGVLGEFCTGSWAVRLVLGEICFVVAPSVCAVAGFPPPTGAPSWPSAPAARSTLVAVGVLRHAKPSGGVSPACRTLAWRNSPRLVAARPWFAVVWHPHRRPPRRKTLKSGC